MGGNDVDSAKHSKVAQEDRSPAQVQPGKMVGVGKAGPWPGRSSSLAEIVSVLYFTR
jgi:hypothetical protein